MEIFLRKEYQSTADDQIDSYRDSPQSVISMSIPLLPYQLKLIELIRIFIALLQQFDIFTLIYYCLVEFMCIYQHLHFAVLQEVILIILWHSSN